MILERINGPEDIKKISEKELPTLAKEVRSALINRLSAIGVIPNSEFRINKMPCAAPSNPNSEFRIPN